MDFKVRKNAAYLSRKLPVCCMDAQTKTGVLKLYRLPVSKYRSIRLLGNSVEIKVMHLQTKTKERQVYNRQLSKFLKLVAKVTVRY